MNMTGYIINIEEKTFKNNYFREVLFTTNKSQLVVMALKPGEEIGAEVHPEHKPGTIHKTKEEAKE